MKKSNSPKKGTKIIMKGPNNKWKLLGFKVFGLKEGKKPVEDWEKEFDEQFGFLGTYNADDIGRVEKQAVKYMLLKDFIRSLLTQK